jgi:uncharacterized protein
MKRKVIPDNPFVLTGYWGKDYFCNREAETSKLMDAIHSQRPIAIYAPRKMGKSGLIQHLFQQKELKEYSTLYIDLFETTSVEGLLKSLSMEILNRFEQKQDKIIRQLLSWFSSLRPQISLNPQTGKPELGLSMINAEEGYPSLKALADYLEGQNKPIVLALDEFQQIGTYGGHGLEAEFRKIFQGMKNTRLIISGSTQHLLVPMFTDPARPLYQSVDYLKLDYLKEDEYADFIHRHFAKSGKKLNQDVLQFILQWSRRHTYYTQLLCNRLYTLGTSSPGIHELTAVVNSLYEERQMIFQQIRNSLTKAQYDLLQAIAASEKAEQVSSSDFIQKYQLGAHSTVLKSLQALVRDEYVLEEIENGKTHYRVYDVLLGRWLEKLYRLNMKS